MTRIKFSRKFRNYFQKAPKEIKIRFDERLDLFLLDSMNPKLHNHALSGVLRGFRSINVTGDWRALYRETDSVIIFEAIGTHSKLYK